MDHYYSKDRNAKNGQTFELNNLYIEFRNV